MPTITRRKLTAALALALAPLGAGLAPVASAAINLNGIGFVQYGDAQSYSLPIACVQVGQDFNQCDFNVASTPGQIQDLVVLATGSSGGRSTPTLPAWTTPSRCPAVSMASLSCRPAG